MTSETGRKCHLFRNASAAKGITLTNNGYAFEFCNEMTTSTKSSISVFAI